MAVVTRPGSPAADLAPAPGLDGPPLQAATASARASRWWLLAGFLVVLLALLPEAFGRQVYDTKLDLITDPVGFLHRLLYLWDPRGWFGALQDQYQGYAFPTAPFFAIGHVAHVPAWLMQRLWMAICFTAAYWGVVRLAEAFEIGSTPTRIAGGLAYALWPVFTILIGPNTSAIVPGVLMPWVLLPLVRGTKGGSPVRAALLSAGVVLLIGGVNAADTLDALTLPAIYLLTRHSSVRKRMLIRWWVLGVVLATAWWALPLLFLGKYGYNFLPYIEQSLTTTGTMSATSALQGAGDWTAYLNLGGLNWEQAGVTVVSLPVVQLGSALLAGLGLFGLARRDLPERRFFRIVIGFAVLAAMSGYWGLLGSPVGGVVRQVLNGILAPFRNVYKFEPLLALAVAIGIVHALDCLRRRLTKGSLRLGLLAVVAVLLSSIATPYYLGRAVQGDSFAEVPHYWYQVADYLAHHSPRNTALVLPAAAHGFYTWGWSVDEPLEALARSPWADRETVPFGGPAQARVMDVVDQALKAGVPVPGLAALLHRSGVNYVVVQNDTQWQLSDSPSPYQVHNVLVDSGIQPVASFGPTLQTGIANNPTISIVPTALHADYPAVQIYRVDQLNGLPWTVGAVSTYPASSVALVSGGPEALLQLSGQGVINADQATVLDGNWHGAYTGELWAVTDTLRRQNIQFGLVNDNYGYTLTRTEEVPPGARVPGGPQPPRQLLSFPPADHQTVARLLGAADVTASSSGSWIFSLPEYSPVNVFDGNARTGWVAGSAFGSVGQWIRADFTRARSVAGARIRLYVGGGRAVATELAVTTSRGTVDERVRRTAALQSLVTPPGRTSFLEVTFLRVDGQRPGGPDAGIRAIDVPGLQLQRFLVPPEESNATGARHIAFSFQTTPVDPTSVLRVPPEPLMNRLFSTPRPQSYGVTGSALPVKGPLIDRLLGTSSLRITATSVLGNLPSFRPQNLIDSLPTTSWVAGGRTATIDMSWPRPRALSSVRVVFTRSIVSTRPHEILLTSPAGRRLLRLPDSGASVSISFPRLVTNRLTVSFPSIARHLVPNVFGNEVQAPVGLADLDFPALHDLRVKPLDSVASFHKGCGSGPDIRIDGRLYRTSVTGTYGDLLDLFPLQIGFCGYAHSIRLGSGQHVLSAVPTGSPFRLTSVALVSEPFPTPAVGSRTARVLSWGPVDRTLRIGAGRPTYLEVHQNYNAGWLATLDGRVLRPVELDGWQQGYLVPAGAGGIIHLTFTPQKPYVIALLASALGVLALLVLLFGPFGLRRRGKELPPARPFDRQIPLVVTVVGATCVVALVGGPVAVVVPIVAVVAWRWPRAVPWIALLGMTVAGAVAARQLGTGAQSQIGSFSWEAQLATLTAVSAVLVAPVAGRSPRTTRRVSGAVSAAGSPGGAGAAQEAEATTNGTTANGGVPDADASKVTPESGV